MLNDQAKSALAQEQTLKPMYLWASNIIEVSFEQGGKTVSGLVFFNCRNVLSETSVRGKRDFVIHANIGPSRHNCSSSQETNGRESHILSSSDSLTQSSDYINVIVTQYLMVKFTKMFDSEFLVV